MLTAGPSTDQDMWLQSPGHSSQTAVPQRGGGGSLPSHYCLSSSLGLVFLPGPTLGHGDPQ